MSEEKNNSYLIFCDESDSKGKYYSNFYGGVIVGSSDYEPVTKKLNSKKQELHLFGEIKWSKVSEQYLQKYIELMKVFFDEVRHGRLRIRIMFRQNAEVPKGLTQDQLEGTYLNFIINSSKMHSD